MASGNILVPLIPYANEPPATIYATLDTRNGHPCLDFDGVVDEESVFTAIMPANYASGGITVKLHVTFTSATSGSFRIQTSLERMTGLDIDGDSFAAANSGGGSADGTSGIETILSIAHTDGAEMDSVVVGDIFRLKVRRDADGTSGIDDITTDMELLGIEIIET